MWYLKMVLPKLLKRSYFICIPLLHFSRLIKQQTENIKEISAVTAYTYIVNVLHYAIK
jgi:hypothetical protein